MTNTTIDETTTINDLADAYLVLDPTCTRDEHLADLLMGAKRLNIPTTLNTPLTDEQADALHAWWNEA